MSNFWGQFFHVFMGKKKCFFKRNKHGFANEKMKKKIPQKLLILDPIFFSIANWPKTSQNNIFCSIKNVSMRDFYVMTLNSVLSFGMYL